MTKFFRKHWPLVAIVTLLLVVSTYLFGRRAVGILQNPPSFIGFSEEGLKLGDIHYTQNNPGEGETWVLDAKEVTFSKDTQSMLFSDYLLKLEQEDRPPIKLKGKKGDYDKSTGVINLRGDLFGYTDNGYSIETDHITYREKENYLTSEEQVKIKGPFFTIEGRGLDFHPGDEILKIRSQVTVFIDKKTLSLDREKHSLNRETLSLDREKHSLNRETLSLDRETHSLDRETHSLDRETHSLDRETLSP